MRARETREYLFSQGLKVFHRQPGRTDTCAYIPLNLWGLITGERLTFSLHLKVSENQGGEIKYLPYLEEGDILDARWLDPLAKMGINFLYFHQEDLERVLAYLNNYLQLLEAEGTPRIKQKLNVLTEHLNLTLRQAFAAPRLGPHIKIAQKQVDRLLAELQKDQCSLKIVWEILSRHYNLYSHSVNVCVLGTAMMVFLQKGNRDIRLLGIAGLFHDVGMTRLPNEILYKSEELTTEEREETKKHPSIGMHLLKGCPTIPVEGVRLVLEHHENANGTGYPEGLPLHRQHPWTRILHLVDTYDSLTTFRFNRPALTPFAALKFLQEQEGPQGPVFEPRTLKHFIRFLALS